MDRCDTENWENNHHSPQSAESGVKGRQQKRMRAQIMKVSWCRWSMCQHCLAGNPLSQQKNFIHSSLFSPPQIYNCFVFMKAFWTAFKLSGYRKWISTQFPQTYAILATATQRTGPWKYSPKWFPDDFRDWRVNAMDYTASLLISRGPQSRSCGKHMIFRLPCWIKQMSRSWGYLGSVERSSVFLPF